MKLATLKDSTRDGRLVVVSRDLTLYSEVGHIARTLQAALDDWDHVGPRLALIAEGIETSDQAEWLRAMGCHLGQGFLYAQAMPAGMVAELLQRFARKPEPEAMPLADLTATAA